MAEATVVRPDRSQRKGGGKRNEKETRPSAIASRRRCGKRRDGSRGTPATRSGRTGKNPRRLGRRTSVIGASGVGEEGPAEKFRPVIRGRDYALRRSPAGDHRAGGRRTRYRTACFFFLRPRYPERAHGRLTRHQRRNPGRRARPWEQRVHGAQGWSSQNGSPS